ncbi:FMN-dependent NADH-azoreductase [Amphiplicatus metriothermophilus]|uniref:FMN dependent NADH:quinone oxidoreductase n=1 Tax=Amphiplicatus metriothermophilus TaxID=1519374 RepID=A0A239PVC9_9PROT|nr:NAD(P)H-dependent oxidoreductase [Amphiplicatus metriothermophilus]MBB5519697.1 FMN-dependent NADH-azoreductase [Amphiplicatus metriothermophilus]SNT74259.1 FMN-dependent NADH-azoreductase [Amphiplicatus metriothermophilus]
MKPLNILQIHASIQGERSATRRLSDALLAAVEAEGVAVAANRRDLSEGVPLIDAEWAAANGTPPEQRSARQNAVLAFSESLIEEIEAADILVIGVPVYNFGIPAALKAWIDLIARARRTFRYAENGPEGLLKGKRAILVAASGGTQIGSPADFAASYLKFVLGFLGITDVTIIDAAGQATDAAGAEARARKAIADTAKTLAADVAEAA